MAAHRGGLMGGDRFAARLERWAADARADEAARRRSQQRWLQQSAAEGATLAGVVLDLAERRSAVTVQTRSGRRHRGPVVMVGDDFVAVRTDGGGHVLVSLGAVASVRSAPGAAPSSGDRPQAAVVTLAAVLSELAAERERLVLVTAVEAVSGELRGVGADVATVRADGSPPGLIYVPLAAVEEVLGAGH